MAQLKTWVQIFDYKSSPHSSLMSPKPKVESKVGKIEFGSQRLLSPLFNVKTLRVKLYSPLLHITSGIGSDCLSWYKVLWSVREWVSLLIRSYLINIHNINSYYINLAHEFLLKHLQIFKFMMLKLFAGHQPCQSSSEGRNLHRWQARAQDLRQVPGE